MEKTNRHKGDRETALDMLSDRRFCMNRDSSSVWAHVCMSHHDLQAFFRED